MKFLYIFLSLFMLSFSAFSAGFWDFDKKVKKDQKAETRGNWFWGLGANYQTAGNQFNFTSGTQAKITPEDSVFLPGGELRLGREFRLGRSLSFILSLNISYGQDEDEDQVKPLKETNVDVALQETTIRMSALRGSISAGLGFFPFKLWGFTFLPVAELGLGQGKLKKYANYYYDDTISVAEYYYEKYEQDFSMFRVGLGFNIISPTGFYSYFRFYSMTYDIEAATGKRSESFQISGANPSVTTPSYASGSETQFSVSIGLGQRF